jgi:predicted dienelactone hydrolase
MTTAASIEPNAIELNAIEPNTIAPRAGVSTDSHGVPHVGCVRISVDDAAAGAPIALSLLYPTDEAPAAVRFGPYTLEVALNAAVREGSYPLVMISHGTRSSPMVFRTLAQFLAGQGFIVGLLEHPFDCVANASQQYSYENLVNRPRQIDLAAPGIGAAIRPEQISLIGHSVGAYAVLAAAGAAPDTSSFVDFCHAPENHATPDWTALVRQRQMPSGPVALAPRRQHRIAALVLLAPDMSMYQHPGALDQLSAALLLMVAEHDLWAQESLDLLKASAPPALAVEAKMIGNAGHYSFISQFPEAIRAHVGEAGRDPEGFDRAAFLSTLEREVLAFLRAHAVASPS